MHLPVLHRLALLLCLFPALAAAQTPSEDEEAARSPSRWAGLDEWATAVTDVDGTWVGPRVPLRAPSDRPTSAVAIARSITLPLTVHADPAVVDRSAAALAGLEAAALAMRLERWPQAQDDGGRGGSVGFDLYLRDEPAFLDAVSPVPSERLPIARPIRTGLDGMVALADTDAGSTFAELSSDVPGDRVFVCAFQAYVEAALRGADVAESVAVHRAFAVWLTERVTGVFGCDEQHIVDQQRFAERGFITHEPDAGEGGAILLGVLGERHDRNAGTFLPALFDFTRQWTRDGGDPYGIPDFWWVLGRVLEVADDDGPRFYRELGMARWFAGTRRGSARFEYLSRLPDEATIVPYAQTEWSRLPRTLACDREVEPLGSAYATVAIGDVPDGSYLRIWLEGERPVRWSLGAARVGAAGRDIGHAFAPARDEPRAYLVVELLPGTAQVVIAVTSLGVRTLDADEPDDFMRSFRLVVDRVVPE